MVPAWPDQNAGTVAGNSWMVRWAQVTCISGFRIPDSGRKAWTAFPDSAVASIASQTPDVSTGCAILNKSVRMHYIEILKHVS